MTEELLHKFFENRCTSEELYKIIHWVKKDALDINGKELSFSAWKECNDEEYISNQKEYDSLLDKIHHSININNNKKKTLSKSSAFQWFIRTAAIFLFPVTLFLIYVISHPFHYTSTFVKANVDSIEVIAPVGSKTIVQLEDGTRVFLNHGSRLKYPQKFAGKKREVKLTGEGYFDVTHNPSKPFCVKTKNISVIALGTSFNVMAYDNEPTVEIALVSGVVNIVGNNENNEGAKFMGQMKPGQYVCYNFATRKTYSVLGNLEKYTSWRNGKLIFKNDPIDVITRRLSRWYNVDIEFADNKIKKYTYTATFRNETLTQILDLMVLATPISYSVKHRRELKNGSYTKEKIIIKLKNN